MKGSPFCLIVLGSLLAFTTVRPAGAEILSVSSRSFLLDGSNLDAASLIVAAGNYPAVNSPPFTTPLASGFDGTTGLLVTRSDGTFICSGALIGSDWVLTAAHCLSNSSGQMITSHVDSYFFPTGLGGTAEIVGGGGPGAFVVNPSYNGAVINDYDIALIHLSSAPTGVYAYSLYSGAVTTAPFLVVGFGKTGDGATGATQNTGTPTLTRRHVAYNNFDFFDSPGVLISDFDNGLAANDASCVIASVCDLGLGSLESSTAPGDSGGPVFLNGKIVGVTSFGARTGNPPDIDANLNSSFGEFAGFTYVGFNSQFVESTVPEPTTVLLMAGALGLLAAVRRKLGSDKTV